MSVRGHAWRGVVAAIFLTFLVMNAAWGVENESFGVRPHPERVDGSDRRTFGIPLEPGAVFEDAVRIYNRTDQAVDLAIYAADAEAGVDGTISVGFRGARPKGVGAWIKLSREDLSLPPRGEAVVPFRVEVRSSDPSFDLGAIVVENSEGDIAADLAQRLHLVLRTAPANTPTTSTRVRPLLLRSPWVIVAILGLLLALSIVWLGARRARRSRVEVATDPDDSPEPSETPAASRPVLRHLGETEEGEKRREPPRNEVGAISRSIAEASERSAARARVDRRADDRPLLDNLLVEVDEGPRFNEPSKPPTPSPRFTPTQRRAPASQRRAKAAKASVKEADPSDRRLEYIPLDEL